MSRRTTSLAASRSPGRLRRAKPLLGTLVDIQVEAENDALAQAATSAAFAEIALVHRLMSFHEASSDVSRLNSARAGAVVEVDVRTAEVLRWAALFCSESRGAFDIGVADALVRSGALPIPPDARGPTVSTMPIATADRRSVLRGDAAIDLGGIAKGYAVDRAIDVLMRFGVFSALVNAGGDLRHFGVHPIRIELRDPEDASRIAGSIQLCGAALASSATIAIGGPPRDESGNESVRPCALVDPRSGTALRPGVGASVAAPSCVIADAMTKVLLVSGPHEHERSSAHNMLSRHGARMILLRAAFEPAIA